MNVEDTLDRLVQRAVRDKKQAQALAGFLKSGRAKKFVETVDAMKGDTVSVSFSAFNCCLYITINVEKLDGFKGERIKGILETLEYLNPSSTDMQEYAAQLKKEFTYTYNMPYDEANDFTPRVYVRVEANVSEESESCRKQLVEIVQPEPVARYKLVCDDDMDTTLPISELPHEDQHS